MKYYWIASTMEIKKKDIKNTLCASVMRGEGNMPLNSCKCRKGVSPDTKMCFPTTGFP